MASEGSSSSRGNTSSYAKDTSRITKENLFMVLALWMERFPVDQEEGQEENPCYKKVGAVLVLPNDMLYAVDCTRNGVHGVARLLMAHQDILQDCKVFVSRKPCALCTKLLVQSKVKRVFYLPIEPEYYSDIEKYIQEHEDMDEERKKKEKEEYERNFEEETSCVDNLFKVSAIGQSVFVPKAGKEVLDDAEAKHETPEAIRGVIKIRLMKTYWNENWMGKAKGKLPWPAFDDNMETQVRNDFEGVMEWMARILVGTEKLEKEYNFKAVLSAQNENMPFNPEENSRERLQAQHLITLAKFLAERTDDPRKGVGAVIINKEKEIVALGWNGFPTKALYGEFPRASDKDKAVQDKKYPYIVHAEQNALLMRNTKNIAGGTLFVTLTPCHDCTPLLEMHGIKTVVLGGNLRNETRGSLNYESFCGKVDAGVFICFEMKSAGDSGGEPPTKKRKLDP